MDEPNLYPESDNGTSALIDQILARQASYAEVIALRRAALHAVIACDEILGWRTEIRRVTERRTITRLTTTDR